MTQKHITALEVFYRGRNVGLLRQDVTRQIWFQYASSWLDSGFNLMPNMDFSEKPQQAPDPEFNGLHGIFHDSLPDGWGLLLMDRAFKEHLGWSPSEITPLDRLGYMANRSFGALEYAPCPVTLNPSDQIDLPVLWDEAQKTYRGATQKVFKALYLQGGSPGGARPKIAAALSRDKKHALSGFSGLPDGYAHWLIKFRSSSDGIDAGPMEKAYADMASSAGIEMPETTLLALTLSKKETLAFAVKRFDRDDDRKIHMLSLAGGAYANFRVPSMDYEDILSYTWHLTACHEEVRKMYTLAVFNAFLHNADDHVKNFAYLYKNEKWQVAPGYDLTVFMDTKRQHSSSYLGKGIPTSETLRQLATKFSISDAEKILGHAKHVILQWDMYAAQYGVRRKSIRAVRDVLNEVGQNFADVVPVPPAMDKVSPGTK